jgi:hypothetical protein
MRFFTREKAAEYVNSQGLVVKGKGLKDHATRGTGPEHHIVNGRAVYTREALDKWISEQVARPVSKRRSRSEVQLAP